MAVTVTQHLRSQCFGQNECKHLQQEVSDDYFMFWSPGKRQPVSNHQGQAVTLRPIQRVAVSRA